MFELSGIPKGTWCR